MWYGILAHRVDVTSQKQQQQFDVGCHGKKKQGGQELLLLQLWDYLSL